MKIIDKIKKDKITPLMCVTGSFGPISDCSNVPYFCFWAIGSFFIVMPIVLYFLLNLKAKKKSESVSFVRFIGFLLLSYPLYVIFLYFFLRIFGVSFYGTFMEWRKAIFMTLLFAGLISFVLFLLKKVKWPYFFIPFLMVLGCLWMMLFVDFC